MDQKNILYIGTDSEFSREFKHFMKLRDSSVFVKELSFSPGILVRESGHGTYGVIIDFTDHTDSDYLIKEVTFLKKTHFFKSVLLVSLFKDEEQRREYPHLYATGFHLSFIKGSEQDLLFKNIFYMALGERTMFPDFAKASDLQQVIEAGICSSITRISTEDFQIETDAEETEGRLRLSLPIFPDLKCEEFLIKEMVPSGTIWPMTMTYKLEYPFPEPWGDETESTIQKETVETWIDLNDGNFNSKNSFILVVTSDPALLSEIYPEDDELPFFTEFSGSLDDETLAGIRQKKPDLIFIDFANNNLDTEELNKISWMIELVRSQPDYSPVVVLMNFPSTGPSMMKVLDYQFILASQGPLTRKIFKSFATTLIAKKKSKDESHFCGKFLAAHDKRRAIDVFQPVKVSCLTEHVVTFISSVELPIFSVLHFQLPLEFYATVVPPFYDLPSKSEGRHHMAIIHGLSEKELMKLRQIINQLILDPKIDFSQLVSKPDEEVCGQVQQETPAPEKPREKELSTIDSVSYVRRSFKGKSKL